MTRTIPSFDPTTYRLLADYKKALATFDMARVYRLREQLWIQLETFQQATPTGPTKSSAEADHE